LYEGFSAGKSGLCCDPFVRRCGPPVFALSQSHVPFVGCFSLGPRKNDLTNYWAPGPFVRPFTSSVDPGDICPPQSPCHQINHYSLQHPSACAGATAAGGRTGHVGSPHSMALRPEKRGHSHRAQQANSEVLGAASWPGRRYGCRHFPRTGLDAHARTFPSLIRTRVFDPSWTCHLPRSGRVRA
jgi:hypothetical protein